MAFEVWPGYPYPLGATWDGAGVNFALFSEHATGVTLCFYDDPHSGEEVLRIPLHEHTDQVWHCYVPDVQPGQLYGYRVSGPYAPEQGLRFNPAKLLIDPYAKAIADPILWDDAVFGYRVGGREDFEADPRDDAAFVPKCVVIDSAFDWGDDAPPSTPLHRSVIYEVHVKGFTKLHPQVPEELRGTYAGLASPASIEYLKQLGVTAVELLPIHQKVDDRHLVDQGLSNYWGYNTLNYFSPDARYASRGVMGEQVREFKAMVKTLHAAGIEVILDVVYNHTAEGNHLGPTLSFKGIDNRSYYHLVREMPRYYMDYTGCGNTLNMGHPRTIQMVMDSLRYWVTEMHVDGFRFDLASALARTLHEVDMLASFFTIIHQDPVLSQVKLIAEPWDVGEGGYQVGNFPVLWAEWNGQYRDTVRKFWNTQESNVGNLAYRLVGSPDLYQHTGRRPYASINFVTAHDGFTLHDLVSYERKHNEANGEENRDGESNNISVNFGVEGETEEEAILDMRYQQMRNFLATLLFSQGAPMINGGDEFGRTQRGNNNAYCQDNELTWFDWELDERQRELLDFTRRLVRLRHEHPVLRRPKFFQGRQIRGTDIKDVQWYGIDGQEMTDDSWNSGLNQLGVLLAGVGLEVREPHGAPIHDDNLLVLFNGGSEPVSFHLPGVTVNGQVELQWETLIDTARPRPDSLAVLTSGEDEYEVAARSVVLLCQQARHPEEEEHAREHA